jgi:hypothetical protein
VFKKYLIVVNTALLLGCNTMLLGSYGEQNQTLEAFSQRVENVFKFQNSMTNAVMLLETEPTATILEAEQKMQLACEPLNEYATREMDGLSADFALQRRVEQTAVSCETAAQRLHSLLLR